MSENTVKKLEEKALAWPERAAAIIIRDQDTYDQAAELVVQIVGLRKQVVDHHKPIKEAAHLAHKAAVDAEKKLLEPLQHAESTIKRAIGEWDAEQQRRRREEQERLEAVQRKADEEARLALAAEAEANGATEETVSEILETPVVAPVAVATPTYQRANGVATQQRWRAEVTDIKALCRAIADGKASLNLVQANMPALNSMARAMRQTFNIPGCKAVAETAVAVRGR